MGKATHCNESYEMFDNIRLEGNAGKYAEGGRVTTRLRRDDRYGGPHSVASVLEHYFNYKLKGS